MKQNRNLDLCFKFVKMLQNDCPRQINIPDFRYSQEKKALHFCKTTLYFSSGISFPHVLNSISREKLRQSHCLNRSNSSSQASLFLTSAQVN